MPLLMLHANSTPPVSYQLCCGKEKSELRENKKTHTHTQRERERRERQRIIPITGPVVLTKLAILCAIPFADPIWEGGTEWFTIIKHTVKQIDMTDARIHTITIKRIQSKLGMCAMYVRDGMANPINGAPVISVTRYVSKAPNLLIVGGPIQIWVIIKSTCGCTEREI